MIVPYYIANIFKQVQRLEPLKNLLLLRHAKSSWANPDLIDFDRGLNDRGNRAAQAMAVHLLQEMPLPDMIICSSAQRTRETLAYLLKSYAHPIDVEVTRDLYMASDLTMMEKIKQVSPEVETLMVLAHNPGMEELAMMLCSTAQSALSQEMYMKYPTAACAHFIFEVACWSEIKRATGTLQAFVRPKDILV